MSKNCPNCGVMLDDYASFCTTCGTRFDNPAPAPAPKKAAPDKAKLIKIGAACVAGLALILVVYFLFLAHPYKSVIETAYGMEYGNFEKMESLAPAEYWEWYEDRYDMDVEDLIESREENYEDNKRDDMYGDNVSVSVEVIKEISLPKGQVEKMGEYLDEAYEIDAKTVTAAKKVYFNATIKSDVYAGYGMENSCYVIQIGGKWYVISSPSYDSSEDVWAVSFVLGY